jgi:superfamily I DNA and RNA helicase
MTVADGHDRHRAAPLGDDGVAFLYEFFARSFTLERPAAANLQADEDEIRVITDQQAQILGLMRHVKHVAIPGPAGTGKTALAVEKARQLARSGQRTLLLCFNRPLGKQLEREVGAEKNLIVRSFHILCRALAERAGIPLADPADARLSDLFRVQYPNALKQAIARLADQRFDAVVVDEGQDFDESWLSAIESLLREPEQGILFVFFDDN